MSNSDYLNKISFGDCLDLMKSLDDNSIDMVLCDLPYGTTARNKWDIIIPFEPFGKRCPLTCSLDYEYDKDKIHPTQKPLGLFEYLITTYTDKNDVVLDNCSGAGTTAIAATNLERNFICFENDQEIYDKSVARLENIKGKNSVISTGNP